MSLLRPLGLISLGLVSLVSCASKQPSTIVVGLSSEAPVPQGVDRIRITVITGGQTRLDADYDVGPNGTKVPGTLVIEKAEDTDAATPVTVLVRAYQNDNERMSRRATMGFSDGKQKLLRMPIQFACFNTECDTGQTCHAGACVPEAADPEKLPDFSEDQVIPKAGTCFPREDCEAPSMAMTIDEFREKVAADPTFFNASECSVAVKEAREDLNMGLVWNEEPTGNWTIIDFDQDEGWSFTDDTHTRVKLAPGLCAELQKPHPRVAKMVAKSGCKPKPATQPECPSDGK